MAHAKPSHRVQVFVAVLIGALGVPVLMWLLLTGSLGILGTRPSPTAPSASPIAPGSEPAAFVGAAACRVCHEAEFDAWRGSHHDLAMQVATDETVLADFSDATFQSKGVTTRFRKRDGKFLVQTQGPDGATHEYQAAYTFGVTPLQQYLLALPGGRYQAFTIAWDARPAEQGGQRWFDLYPDEPTPPGDELHWAAPAHTWNFACAECHSTNLVKGYDIATDSYNTTWSDINVGCETCHGPGSRHVEIATAAKESPDAAYPASAGLIVNLRAPGRWKLEPGATVASLVETPTGASEIESCARCHARRTQLSGDYAYRQPLAATHRVQLLQAPYYFADGQVLEEDYVYASFRQSRMHDMGVTCGDCHDPHSLKLHAPGNALCTTCHAAATYDVVEHHHHEMGTDGAKCVECHMPTRTYMVVDPRRDHSMRIPRPDLTVALGVPNACNACHSDQTAQWSADAITRWYGPDFKPGHQTFAQAFYDAREGSPGAGAELAAIANDPDVPTIARATALAELTPWLGPDTLPAIEAGLRAQDPLLRAAAIEALAEADTPTQWSLASPLLDDPILSVRLEAAGLLSSVRPESVDPARRPALERAFAEYVAWQEFNADRAEHWVNLAGFHSRQGDTAQAERDYAEALRRNPRFVPAYANHADMLRELGREADAERVLRAGLEQTSRSAPLHHSLGLLLVRTQRLSEGVGELKRAHELAPADARFAYVYAVALSSTNDPAGAIRVWEDVVARHPNDLPSLHALTIALAQSGQAKRALPYAERIATLLPGDADAARLVSAIRDAAARSN